MRRLLPNPALSVGLLLVWLLLMQSVSAGTVALGVVQAVFWPLATAPLRPGRPRRVRFLRLLRLLGVVLVFMLRSNLEVARAILSPRASPRSGFVRIPLTLRDPHALAALAAIITFTPGTVWSQLAPDRSALLLHVLAVQSEEDVIALIHRYERLLEEVFG